MTQPLDPEMPWESGLITVLGADPMNRRDFWGPQWIALTNSYSAPTSAQPWNDALPTADPGNNRFTIYRKTRSGDGGGAFHVIEGVVGWYEGAPGSSPNDHYVNEFRARSLAALALRNGPNPLDPATFDTAAEGFYNTQAWLNTAIPRLQAEVDKVGSAGSGFQGTASEAFMSVITALRDEMIELITDMRNPRDWVQLLQDNAAVVRTFWAQIQAAWQEYESRPDPAQMINSVLSQINSQVQATAAASGSDWTAAGPAWDQISAWPFTIDFGAGPKTYDFHDPNVFHQLDLDMHGLWLGNAYTLDTTMLAQVAALRDSFATTQNNLRDLPGNNTSSNAPATSSSTGNATPAGTNTGGDGTGAAPTGDSGGGNSGSGGDTGAAGAFGGGAAGGAGSGGPAPLFLAARFAGGGSFGGTGSGGGDFAGGGGSVGGFGAGSAGGAGSASAGDDLTTLDPGGDQAGGGGNGALALSGMLAGGFRAAATGDPDDDERRGTTNITGLADDADIETSTLSGGVTSIGSQQPDPVAEATVVHVDQRRLVGGGQFGAAISAGDGHGVSGLHSPQTLTASATGRVLDSRVGAPMDTGFTGPGATSSQFSVGGLGAAGNGGPSAQSALAFSSNQAAPPVAGGDFGGVLGREPSAGTSGLSPGGWAGGGPPFGPGNPPPATAFNVGRLASAPLDPAGAGPGGEAVTGSAPGVPPAFGPMRSFGGGPQPGEQGASSWLAEDRIEWGAGDGKAGTIGRDDDDEGDAVPAVLSALQISAFAADVYEPPAPTNHQAAALGF
jgi:hypothetical protein